MSPGTIEYDTARGTATCLTCDWYGIPVESPPGIVSCPACLAESVDSDFAFADLRGVNRNDPCPCGSGSKYKKCHGRP